MVRCSKRRSPFSIPQTTATRLGVDRSVWHHRHVRIPYQPMLATNRPTQPLAGEWALEPKFDGWRVIVAIDDDVRVWTRAGHDLTERLPEIATLVDHCGGASVVLDGELVAGQGR